MKAEPGLSPIVTSVGEGNDSLHKRWRTGGVHGGQWPPTAAPGPQQSVTDSRLAAMIAKSPGGKLAFIGSWFLAGCRIFQARYHVPLNER
jgi:hypothetical protein